MLSEMNTKMAAENSVDTLIRTQIENANHFVVTSHIRPDGDAIGSMLGFANALKAAGKHVECVLQDDVTQRYWFLPGALEVKRILPDHYDYLIVVDSADSRRVGSVLANGVVPDLVIDHHKTHDNFGRIDYVEPETEATALLLVEKLPDWGLEVTIEVASCLMTGILTDTLGFRTNNTSAKALRAAADLMEMGVDLVQVYNQSLLMRTLPEIRYWGQGLTKLEFFDGVLTSTLTLDDRIIAGYPENDDADLINTLTTVPDALVSVLFIEQENESVKVSWRSVKGIDVSKLASKFGGGGHESAAGADIPGSLHEVRAAVLHETKSTVAKLRAE